MNAAAQIVTSVAPRHRLARIADLAIRALLDEAELTPKPGLIDRRGSGAHSDMTLSLFQRSAFAIAPGIRAMVQAAAGQVAGVNLRETLGRIGRETEAAMLAASGGVNTHRGAIWAMGLLASAAAMNPHDIDPRNLAATAAALASLPDRFAPSITTNGIKVGRRFSCTGARGEAMAGFPHVLRYGLPALHAARANGASEDYARIDALLAIMAHLTDTCLLHRGGYETLQIVRSCAADVLAAGGTSVLPGRLLLRALDEILLQLWASPGGSADLLGATLFLDSLQTPEHHGTRPEREGIRANLGL